MILYFDEEIGEVKIVPEAMALSEVKDLYSSDHTTNKTLWKQWIKYIYFVYKKDGVFSNDLIASKRKEVCSRFFPERDPLYFEQNPKVKAVIQLYVRKQYTHWERLFEKWKEDVDSYITYLTDVPYTRKRKVVVPGLNGAPDQHAEEEFPNIDEKKKAQNAIVDLVKTGKELEAAIFNEKKENSGRLNPMFDEG